MVFTAYETGYLESNLLLALLDDNPEGARAIARELMPGERRRLSEVLGELENLLDEVRAAQG